MQIRLNLVLSVILEAVKAETHIKGSIDRSRDDAASKLAYHETAGDEEVHERKLMRSIYTTLDELKGELSNYVINSGLSASTGDNVCTIVNEGADTIVIRLEVSNNFNTGYTDSLARLCSRYVEDATLALWYGTFDANQLQYYTALKNADVVSISKCFVKLPPKKATVPYTNTLSLSRNTLSINTGTPSTVTYTIDESAMDDVEIFLNNKNVAWKRVNNGFSLVGLYAGSCTAKIYSLHNEEISANVTITVSGNTVERPSDYLTF